MTNLESIFKKQRHYFASKPLFSQSCGFSSSHLWMWELDHKEGWALKNWCFWTVVLTKTFESPLVCKENNPKGNQYWVLIGSIDAKAEAPILWPPDEKSLLFHKDPDAGKDWRQEKGTTEDAKSRTWLSNWTTRFIYFPGETQFSVIEIKGNMDFSIKVIYLPFRVVIMDEVAMSQLICIVLN